MRCIMVINLGINVGPTPHNKTRLIFEYWALEYAEYDDGS